MNVTAIATDEKIDLQVPAEDAPIGFLVWPVTAAEYAPNFTLAQVVVIRASGGRRWVRWVYESGKTRDFMPGEKVLCRIAEKDHAAFLSACYA